MIFRRLSTESSDNKNAFNGWTRSPPALSVVPVMAAAGLIVGVMTLTGLGLKLANIIVMIAGGNLMLTALLSAVSVILLGHRRDARRESPTRVDAP